MYIITYCPDTKETCNRYRDYLNSLHWEKKRNHKLAVYPCCEVCKTEKELHIHHLHYDTLGYEDIHADLRTLCRTCHKFAHTQGRNDFERPVKSVPKAKKYKGKHLCSECMYCRQQFQKYRCIKQNPNFPLDTCKLFIYKNNGEKPYPYSKVKRNYLK